MIAIFVLFFILLWCVSEGYGSTFLVLSLYTLAFLLLMVITSYKRSKELSLISHTINLIWNDKISKEEDIILPETLHFLESEIRRMYGRMKHDIEYLRKLERVRTEFLGNVSHELKTPIFAIQGFLETLLDGAMDDKKVNRLFLEKAGRHAGNLNNLVSDLIDISLIEAGEMRLSFRYFSLSNFTNEIIDEQAPFAAQKGLHLLFTPMVKDVDVYGDKAKLKQVMNNLIQNAIKYTEEGSITVSAAVHGKQVRVVVKDTGPGIAAEHLPRIFERFYRVDRARSRAAGGTGLGLAIAKHILEAHESKIEVMSTVGVGSEFSFCLKR